MTTIHQGIYLEDNPPARSQFRVGRRSDVRSVIVFHTAESGTDEAGADPKAENVANFTRNRTDAGSYHLLGDTDSIVQLVRFENESYSDGTGSNQWAIHISLAMNSADWAPGILTVERRDQLLDTAVDMAAIAAEWLYLQDLDHPAPVHLTRAESEQANASGFISHGRRDPTRRSDPGEFFPWPEFLARYAARLGVIVEDDSHDHDIADIVNEYVTELQAGINRMGWTPPLDEDGIYGPLTNAATTEYLGRLVLAGQTLETMAAKLRAPTTWLE